MESPLELGRAIAKAIPKELNLMLAVATDNKVINPLYKRHQEAME